MVIRIAVVDDDKCRSRKCDRVCYRFCPQVRGNVEAIEIIEEKASISEILCTGCGICIKKCPFKAISIVNIPDELEGECTHRFGENQFRIFRLPTPVVGSILGLLGKNGIGKSAIIQILAGNIKPNLGKYADPPDWTEILTYFRGSTLQDYFQRISENNLRIAHKPQYVDTIPKVTSGKVGSLLGKINERNQLERISKMLSLKVIWNRDIGILSGGELQKVALAATICRDADVYLFDEPSSFLDAEQRLEAARAIKSLKENKKTIIIAEHDLAVLDYLSDYVCVFYGEPAVYGIVSNVHSVGTGINIYLDGFIPDENIRFRKQPIRFHISPSSNRFTSESLLFQWNDMKKTFKGFSLNVRAGKINHGEVIGILGPNGIGKTTFMRLLAGIDNPDKGNLLSEKKLNVSYKPQYISIDYSGTVERILRSTAKNAFLSSWYKSEIIQPLNLDPILDRHLADLSGGELQRIAIATCLSQEADLYLLDEPSAFLDVEERIAMARTIKRITESRNAGSLVVEHDVIAQDLIADQLIIFEGNPGIEGLAHGPTGLLQGMNKFLKMMGITFRRDPDNGRPRVNKENSKLDRLQKSENKYYYDVVNHK